MLDDKQREPMLDKKFSVRQMLYGQGIYLVSLIIGVIVYAVLALLGIRNTLISVIIGIVAGVATAIFGAKYLKKVK